MIIFPAKRQAQPVVHSIPQAQVVPALTSLLSIRSPDSATDERPDRV
jgi:hypothetical protein